ncbi:MAG: hypothetical protein CMM98_04930 [Rickettsiales bacterium]|nr:hypothetical protein [Rickettsiales bacterium]
MHKKIEIKVISFYEFISLNHIEQLKFKLYDFLKIKEAKGTILLAKEGINGTISIKKIHSLEFKNFINEILKKNIFFKTQNHSEHVFLRLKVKIKKEIIKMGEKNICPNKNRGLHVHPDEWDDLIKDKNTMLIDTRNNYESKIGTFKGSILVNSSNFTEFPKWVKKNEQKIKNKKVAMFCTGGVRCEKASSYLRENGFKNVFQLDGGIISYFQQTKNKKKNWVGECFVFDERVSIKENLSKGNYDQCFACRTPINDKDKSSEMFREGISCPNCYKITTTKQKKSFEERNKQISLSKKKGIKHLGN